MGKRELVTEQPRYIKLNERDNVAIVVNDFGLPAGSRFPCGLELRAFVPQGHKTALIDIAEGAPILRYGEVIGHAASAILAGEWVDEARIHMPDAPALDKLEISTAVPAPLPPLEGFTFEGYRNPDGSVGTKNILGISTSVQCVKGTLEYAIKRIRAELLPKYPNVDDVIPVTHAYGCGVAISAPDAVVPIRTLQNIALNPNFGGEVMVVGLGCEKLSPERLVPEGLGDAIVRMQDEAFDSFGAIVERIMTMADARLAVLNQRRRETCPASDLVIGLQCGGSDAFSGVTANPAVGFAADLLVRAGATVMFSEVTEVRDAIQLLTRRAVNEDVGRALIREMAWYDRLSGARRRRPQRQYHPRQQEGRACQYRREVTRFDRQIRLNPDRRRARTGREGAPEGHVVRSDARVRFHLWHASTRFRDDFAGVHDRPRHALRARGSARNQGRDPQRTGAAVERPDRL